MMEKFVVGKKYRCVKDFFLSATPLKFKVKKGEVWVYEGYGLYLSFRKRNGDISKLTRKEAFNIFEQA